jgi:hypothetical protein
MNPHLCSLGHSCELSSNPKNVSGRCEADRDIRTNLAIPISESLVVLLAEHVPLSSLAQLLKLFADDRAIRALPILLDLPQSSFRVPQRRRQDDPGKL